MPGHRSVITIKLLFLPLLIMGITACSSTPPLRVGITISYPPLCFMQNGNLQGVEYDLATELGKITGRKIKFEILQFDRLFPSLETGQIDIAMAGISDTAERRQLVDFSESYLTIGQMLLIREKDVARFPRMLTDKGSDVRIGVKRGTTGEKLVLERFSWGTVVHFDTTESAVNALESGGIDCFVHDAPTVWRFSADPAYQRPGVTGLFEPLSREPLAWGVRKGNRSLLTEVNGALQRMRGDGRLQEIISRWLKVRIQVSSGEE